MNLEKQYPILVKLLNPFRRSQQKTCLAVVSAILEAAEANTFKIASLLAVQSEIQPGSPENRFYRFLLNERFDNWLLTQPLSVLFAERKRVVSASDRTRCQRTSFCACGKRLWRAAQLADGGFGS